MSSTIPQQKHSKSTSQFIYNYLRLVSPSRRQIRGFTLIELLVSMLILAIVVGLTGTGLVYVISNSTKSDGNITQQGNLRRAGDFIADEVKMASVITTTYPEWITANVSGLNLSGTTPTPRLYLEIPMPAELVASGTITIKNHGLVKGNAVRFSGSSLPSTTTYYVKTSAADTFTVVDSSGTDVTSFGSSQNFAVRRLVVYYTATPDTTIWKSPQALYRSTGNCNNGNSTTYTSDSINCLVMVDSLTGVTATVVNKQATITLNGQLCTPASMTNVCGSTTTPPSTPPSTNSVSIVAIGRATL